MHGGVRYLNDVEHISHNAANRNMQVHIHKVRHVHQTQSFPRIFSWLKIVFFKYAFSKIPEEK